MADDQSADRPSERVNGPALARSLASALGDEGRTRDSLTVVDDRGDVEGTADGAFAYAVECSVSRVAEVYVHSDRAHVEFTGSPDRAVAAAESADLRVRPKAVRPPKTLVFVESAAEIDAALDVLAAVCADRG